MGDKSINFTTLAVMLGGEWSQGFDSAETLRACAGRILLTCHRDGTATLTFPDLFQPAGRAEIRFAGEWTFGTVRTIAEHVRLMYAITNREV